MAFRDDDEAVRAREEVRGRDRREADARLAEEQRLDAEASVRAAREGELARALRDLSKKAKPFERRTPDTPARAGLKALAWIVLVFALLFAALVASQYRAILGEVAPRHRVHGSAP